MSDISFHSIRKASPLVHCITNYVAMEFNANALLAVGASPFMSFCKEELKEISEISDSLAINIGCLDAVQIEAMKIAASLACVSGKPWILDPVGAGATLLRKETALSLAEAYHPSVIRGNASEIMALAGVKCNSHGVDSVESSDNARSAADELALRFSTIVSVSGPKDYITDGKNNTTIESGNEMMPMVTAMGCTATALTAAFLAVSDTPFEAAANAMRLMGEAGDIALSAANGPGTLKCAFIDALYNLTTE